MYLIHIPAERAGFDHWLYFERDPRADGSTHEVVEDVEFRGMDSAELAGHGSTSSQFPVLARVPDQPEYRLFCSSLSVPRHYERLEGFAFKFSDWKSFMATPIAKDEHGRPVM
jgi:hypothetical protein